MMDRELELREIETRWVRESMSNGHGTSMQPARKITVKKTLMKAGDTCYQLDLPATYDAELWPAVLEDVLALVTRHLWDTSIPNELVILSRPSHYSDEEVESLLERAQAVYGRVTARLQEVGYVLWDRQPKSLRLNLVALRK